jgi:hypothetical protein
MNRHVAKLAVFWLFCVVVGGNSRACVPLDIKIHYPWINAPAGTYLQYNGIDILSGGPVMQIGEGCWAWMWSCESGLCWEENFVDANTYGVKNLGAATPGTYEEYAIGCNESGSYDTDYAYVLVPADIVNFHCSSYWIVDLSIHETWVWGSNTGSLADLDDIVAGEHLSYPSVEDPYILPSPFEGSVKNPDEAYGWAAQLGHGEDVHFNVKITIPPVTGGYDTTQYYIRAGLYVGPGPIEGGGPFTIERRVYLDGAGWHYCCICSGSGGSVDSGS